jgi:hypothetical protein
VKQGTEGRRHEGTERQRRIIRRLHRLTQRVVSGEKTTTTASRKAAKTQGAGNNRAVRPVIHRLTQMYAENDGLGSNDRAFSLRTPNSELRTHFRPHPGQDAENGFINKMDI